MREAPAPASLGEVRRAVIGSTVGNAIEAYDFLVYGLTAGLVFPAVFFPQMDAATGTMLSLSTILTAFLARPLGAVVFGYFGDKRGRKTTLIATILLMGLGTVGIGLVPGYATLGSSGIVIILVLRALQGFAVGGEWTGASLLALETASPRRSGFVTSFAQGANPLGIGAAYLVIFASTALLGQGAFAAWGWRLPFLFSAALVVVALWLRLRVHETEAFQRVQTEGAVVRFPTLSAIREQPGALLLCVLVRMAALISYYLFTAFALSYAVKSLGYEQRFVLLVLACSAVAAAVVSPLFGWLGDRWGHERIIMGGSVLTGVYAFAYFPMLATGNYLIAACAMLLSLICFASVFAVEGAIITKVFEPRWRYSGSAIAFNLAAIIGAGPAPAFAATLASTGHVAWISVYIAAGCAVTFIAAAFLRSRRSFV